MNTETTNSDAPLPDENALKVDWVIQFNRAYDLEEEGRRTEVSSFTVESLGRSFRVNISSILDESGWVDYSLCYLLSEEEDGGSLAITARVNWTAEITGSVLVNDSVNTIWKDVATIFRKLMREGEKIKLGEWDQSTLLRVLQACIKRGEPLQDAA